MIRVRKSTEPDELGIEGYASDTVKRQLIIDSDEKCYICERHRDTDIEVEHLKSRRKNPNLENDWNNLFIACGYCNKKKSFYHDNMLQPDTCNVEDLIDHRVNLMAEKAEFSSLDGRIEVKSAIRLLAKVFNGALVRNKPRSIIEQRFWDNFKKDYIDFLNVVEDFLKGNEDAEIDIRDLFNIKEEYLAFKYFIIKNNPLLLQSFGGDIVWNKNLP